MPANVQTLDSETLRQSQPISLPEALMSRLPSVNVNEVQGNPFQLDVNYRGFTASPLLGTPQGLSVYQDGVRINEPFGDVVNWDLGQRWQHFAKISNVLDKRYSSAGQLGRSAFDAQGRFISDADDWRNEQFVGPGAPRAA